MTGIYVWILVIFSPQPLDSQAACPWGHRDAAVYAHEADCHAAERALRAAAREDVGELKTECRKLPVMP